jgi:hypothetical protein
VRSALETLPWVERGSVVPSTSRQEVRFVVLDKKGFNLDEVKRVIQAKGFRVGAVKSGL